jgi:hypothetical protein
VDDLLRTVSRTAKALRALAEEGTRPTPPTCSWLRWLGLRLYSLADDLDAEIEKIVPTDPQAPGPNGTGKDL